MKRAFRWSVRKRIGGGFALPLLILVVIGVVSYLNTIRSAETARRVEHNRMVLDKLKGVRGGMTDLETEQRGYALTGDEKYLGLSYTARMVVDQSIKELRNLTANNPNQQRRLDLLEPLVEKRLTLLQTGIELRRNNGPEVVRQWIQQGQGKKRMDEIRELIREMEDEENELLSQHDREARLRSSQTIHTIVYGTAAAFLFVAAAGFFMARSITGPVSQLVHATEKIGSGGLDYRVNLKAEDELGVLAGAFNRMTAQLRDAQEELKKQTSIVQSILASMGDGVVVADTNGAFLVFNRAAEQILGMGPTSVAPGKWSEQYGIFLSDTITPYPPDQLPLARAIRGESADAVELFVQHPGLQQAFG